MSKFNKLFKTIMEDISDDHIYIDSIVLNADIFSNIDTIIFLCLINICPLDYPWNQKHPQPVDTTLTNLKNAFFKDLILQNQQTVIPVAADKFAQSNDSFNELYVANDKLGTTSVKGIEVIYYTLADMADPKSVTGKKFIQDLVANLPKQHLDSLKETLIQNDSYIHAIQYASLLACNKIAELDTSREYRRNGYYE